jgi:hypothetical protein
LCYLFRVSKHSTSALDIAGFMEFERGCSRSRNKSPTVLRYRSAMLVG